MPLSRLSVMLAASSLLIGMSACAPTRSAQIYSESDALAGLEVCYATVVSVQDAVIQGKPEGGGQIGGGVLGGTLGYALAAGPWRPAAVAGAALLGVTVGPFVEKHLKRTGAQQIEVAYEDGKRTIIVQQDDVDVRPGDRVRVIRDRSGAMRVRPFSEDPAGGRARPA